MTIPQLVTFIVDRVAANYGEAVEVDEALNSATRDLVHAMALQNGGTCYLGLVNLYKDHPRSKVFAGRGVPATNCMTLSRTMSRRRVMQS